MKFQIKIWHFIIFLIMALALIRFNLLIDTAALLFIHFKLLFFDFNFAINQINFAIIDAYLSLIFLTGIPIIIFWKKTSNKFLNYKLNFTFAVIALLLFIFLFAPVIANYNVDFQKNLKVTRLLPPFSSVKVLHLNSKKKKTLNDEYQFLNAKNKVTPQSFDDTIIFADSAQINKSGIIYFQKNDRNEISDDDFEWSLKNKNDIVYSKIFLLGTDELGRDVFSRLIYGARISLLIGLGAVIISSLIGLFIGFTAGYFGGAADSILSRFTDTFLAFPIIFLIIFILAFFGSSIIVVIIVLGFSGWMSLFKIVRGEVISIKQKDFFVTSKLLGETNIQLLFKEILPIIFAPVLVNLVFLYGNVILAESALSYLGLGIGSLYPSWGAMIDSGQEYLSKAWWMIFFPGAALFITLYAANKFGKEINNLINPRSIL